MERNNIYISISGLGLTTTEDLKKRIIYSLPNVYTVHWSSLIEPRLDLLIINEYFSENQNIQKIIHDRNIPYLKVLKKTHQQNDIEGSSLYHPLKDNHDLEQWLKTHILDQSKTPPVEVVKPVPSTAVSFKEVDYFADLVSSAPGKYILSDDSGIFAIVDSRKHIAWVNPVQHTMQTDHSIQIEPASVTDIARFPRKCALNLEDYLFQLLWNSPSFIKLPNPSNHYRLKFWPTPLLKDQKVLLQLSASFSLGAEISMVTDKLNIPLTTVQQFINANLAIQNAELISAKECHFAKEKVEQPSSIEQSQVKSFFSKLKRRFGF